jgi:hypothetical protein
MKERERGAYVELERELQQLLDLSLASYVPIMANC